MWRRAVWYKFTGRWHGITFQSTVIFFDGTFVLFQWSQSKSMKCSVMISLFLSLFKPQFVPVSRKSWAILGQFEPKFNSSSPNKTSTVHPHYTFTLFNLCIKRWRLYLEQERVHPFGEGLLLYGQPLFLQRPDAALFELDDILPLRHSCCVGVILRHACGGTATFIFVTSIKSCTS